MLARDAVGLTARLTIDMNARPAGRSPWGRQHGQVAQLVEQWTENPRVGGSIPPLATNPYCIRACLVRGSELTEVTPKGATHQSIHQPAAEKARRRETRKRTPSRTVDAEPREGSPQVIVKG